MMVATLVASCNVIHDSALAFVFRPDGKRRKANLDGTSQQCLAFDPEIQTVHTEGHSVMDGWREFAVTPAVQLVVIAIACCCRCCVTWRCDCSAIWAALVHRLQIIIKECS